MDLRQLAIQASTNYGLVHTQSVRALRDYIKENSIEALAKEIDTIGESSALRAIWEAGVPKQLQDAYFKQLRKVI